MRPWLLLLLLLALVALPVLRNRLWNVAFDFCRSRWLMGSISENNRIDSELLGALFEQRSTRRPTKGRDKTACTHKYIIYSNHHAEHRRPELSVCAFPNWNHAKKIRFFFCLFQRRSSFRWLAPILYGSCIYTFGRLHIGKISNEIDMAGPYAWAHGMRPTDGHRKTNEAKQKCQTKLVQSARTRAYCARSLYVCENVFGSCQPCTINQVR